jgi:PAS domain-containing protein
MTSGTVTSGTESRDHAAIIQAVTEELRLVFEGSPQGMYIYLDETHKVCNQRFAEMLGYDSPTDWDRPASFTDQYVVLESQHTLESTYQEAMQRQVGATIDVTWKRRDGGSVDTSVILVPIAFGGELMALHFITAR